MLVCIADILWIAVKDEDLRFVKRAGQWENGARVLYSNWLPALNFALDPYVKPLDRVFNTTFRVVASDNKNSVTKTDALVQLTSIIHAWYIGAYRAQLYIKNNNRASELIVDVSACNIDIAILVARNSIVCTVYA